MTKESKNLRVIEPTIKVDSNFVVMSRLARLVCCAYLASVVLYNSYMSKYLLVELGVESLEKVASKEPCTDDLAMGYPDSEEGITDQKGKRPCPDPKEKGDNPASKGIARKFKVPTGMSNNFLIWIIILKETWQITELIFHFQYFQVRPIALKRITALLVSSKRSIKISVIFPNKTKHIQNTQYYC